MSTVNHSLQGTWWDSWTDVVVWKPNYAGHKADWHDWRTVCDSALGVHIQQWVHMK